MNFISGKKGYSPILILLVGVLVVFAVFNLDNKTKTPLTAEAAACVPVDQVSTTKTIVDKGECFDCSVRVAAGQGGGYYIACGLAVNNSWPQNICPSSTGYTGCSGFKGWVGDVATFGCQMPTTVANTDILEMVGFDFSATCGPTTGRRIPITLKGTTPPPPTNTPIPNPNCPNGKVDQTGQCNPACCSNHSECNDPHVPGQQNQICTLSNGYCNSGYSCTSAPAATNTPTPGGPPPPPPVTVPPAQACHVGQEVYLVGESWCDEANNSVKRCLGNDNWLRLQLPDPCPGKKCVNDPDPTKHAYSCVSKCQPLIDNAGKKLKIAFLPENYSTYSEFEPVAWNSIDQIKKTNLGSLISKMNFYIINDFTQSYHDTPYKPYEGVQFQKIQDTGAQVCGADSSIVIDNPAKCGGGKGGVAVMGQSSYVCGVGDVTVPHEDVTVPHELAHAIAWLDDEYGDANSPKGPSLSSTYNCSDSGVSPPTSPCLKWIGITGAGCYQGCGTGNDPKLGYSNWYRPSLTSIMRGRIDPPPYSSEFNTPSLKAWEDLLQKF